MPAASPAITIVQLAPHELQAMMNEAIAEALRQHARSSGDLWTIKEVARHYGISERTVLSWERAGRLPKRSGTRWRQADILQFDADRTPKTRPI